MTNPKNVSKCNIALNEMRWDINKMAAVLLGLKSDTT